MKKHNINNMFVFGHKILNSIIGANKVRKSFNKKLLLNRSEIEYTEPTNYTNQKIAIVYIKTVLSRSYLKFILKKKLRKRLMKYKKICCFWPIQKRYNKCIIYLY